MLKKCNRFLMFICLLFLMSGCSTEKPIINSVKDLENKKIGVYTGSEYDSILEKKIEGAMAKYYNSYSDEISALKSGKIDGFLSDEPLAKEIVKNNDGLKILDEKLTEDSYAFAIDPNQEKLQEEINSILLQMMQDGTLNNIANKWMGNNDKGKELPEYDYDVSKRTIKFATVSGSAPFAYTKNNKIVGYDIEVIMYICKELGYKLEVIEMSFDGIIPALISGKVDMAGCSIIVTEERKKSVLFSLPNYTGGIVVVTRDTSEK